MKRIAVFFSMLSFVFLMVAPASASLIYEFDPNDLLDLYPAAAGTSDTTGENKATQENARRVHEQWANSWYETFYNPPAPQTQPNSYNTYMNWRDGLGDGEGISAFNIWLLDNPRARSWGESAVWNPLGPAPTGTADTGGLWNVEVIDNPWGDGWLVQWWTDDPDNYLRPTENGGADIDNFSFSGTAYWDTNENGYDASDPKVALGEEVRTWFGAVNWTEWDDDADEWKQSWSLHFDDVGWGDLTPADRAFSAGLVDSEGHGSGYEGVLNITATPEPTTMLLLGAGILGLAGLGRKRLLKK